MGALVHARLEGADLPDPDGIIRAQLLRAITESALLVERRVKLKTPIGVTEVARGSIGHRIRTGHGVGRGISVRAELGSPARHVPVLERGRRPGRRPPSRALELWVRRKLGIRDPKEARGVAFVIARKIGDRGTDAVRMFEKTAEESQADIQRIFERAGLNIAVRIAST